MVHNGADLGAKKSQKEPEEYHCKKCDFFTCKLGNWKRHLKTKKHNATQMLPDADYLGTKTDENGSQLTGSKSCFA